MVNLNCVERQVSTMSAPGKLHCGVEALAQWQVWAVHLATTLNLRRLTERDRSDLSSS